MEPVDAFRAPVPPAYAPAPLGAAHAARFGSATSDLSSARGAPGAADASRFGANVVAREPAGLATTEASRAPPGTRLYEQAVPAAELPAVIATEPPSSAARAVTRARVLGIGAPHYHNTGRGDKAPAWLYVLYIVGAILVPPLTVAVRTGDPVETLINILWWCAAPAPARPRAPAPRS